MKRLVLVGPGHAHLFVLEALARRRPPGLEVALVSLGEAQRYSGMVPGWLAGDYSIEALSFDLRGLARAAGAQLFPEGAIALEAGARVVRLRSGRALEYDLASADLGSLSAGDDVPGAREHAKKLKPIDAALELDRARGGGDLLVVGGGAAGVEIALCLTARRARRATLVERGTLVPAGASPALARAILRLLAERGIELRSSESVARLEADRALLASGVVVPFTTCVWATGARPSDLLRSSGAALDEQGFLAVHDTLQSTSHPELFAAGDCAGFVSGQHVPKAGVHSVREGPVLAHNLFAHLAGELLRAYRAQRGFLALLNAGDGTALGSWKGFAGRSRALWLLKDRIDRRFMARFQRLATG